MSFNRFLYVNANPVDNADPTGLSGISSLFGSVPPCYGVHVGCLIFEAILPITGAVLLSELGPIGGGLGAMGGRYLAGLICEEDPRENLINSLIAGAMGGFFGGGEFPEAGGTLPARWN